MNELSSLKVLSVFFTVLVVILAVSTSWVWYKIRTETHDTPTVFQFCLPCDDLVPQPGDPIGFVTRKEGNNYVCCLADNASIGKLIEQVVTKVMGPGKKFHGCKNPGEKRLPMIKLVGPQHVPPGVDVHIVRWDVAANMTIQHDVDYTKGRIRVLTSGRYTTYSSLTFRCGGNIDYKGISVTPISFHAVVQQRNIGGQDTIIAESIIPQCQTCASQFYFTSHLEAVIELNTGDYLYVKVHNTSDVLPFSPAFNYFGVHMMA